MDTEKISALLMALELGSLSAAAEVLGYTPSGISRMMASLEAEAGFPLLIRSREGLRPTRECETLLPHFHALVDEAKRTGHVLVCENGRYAGGVGENHGRALIRLEHWDMRHVPEKRIDHVMAEIRRRLEANIPEAKFTLMTPPAIRGLGGIGGVTLFLCSMGGVSINQLAETAQAVYTKFQRQYMMELKQGLQC